LTFFATKILAVASREYSAAVKTKAFVISVVLLPAILLLMAGLRRASERVADRQVRNFAVIDHVGVFDDLNAAVTTHDQQPDAAQWTITRAAAPELQLSDRVRAGTLAGYLSIQPDQIILHAAGASDLSFREFAEREINRLLRRQRLQSAGLNPVTIEPLLKPVALTLGPLAHVDARTGKEESDQTPNDLASIGIPLTLTIVMFLVVVVSAVPMMQGVIEEKQLRIAEVLLASVRPFELMSGKLLGMFAISGTLIAIYAGSALLTAIPYLRAVSPYISVSLIVWFIVFQILAVLMFGSMYIAIGASCSDMKEAQALLLPLNLLIMMPLLVLPSVMQHPDSALSRGLSFFPTAAPFLTIVRIATPPGVAWWEAAAAAIIVLVTTIIFIWAGGRIFRIGIMSGGSTNWSTLLKWAIRG
jgi:ABC-2 type transport system permease protein